MFELKLEDSLQWCKYWQGSIEHLILEKFIVGYSIILNELEEAKGVNVAENSQEN